jgi:hypothetical protein
VLTILLDAAFGALAGALGFLVAKRLAPPKTKPQLYRVLLVVFVVVGFQGAHQFVSPRLLEWKQTRDFDQFLRTDPLFSTILADNPSLKVPLRAAVLKAWHSGKRDEAAVARALLTSVFPQYLARGSEASILEFTNALVHTLRALQARDPERCYGYLNPSGSRSVSVAKDEGRDEVLAAMRDVVRSAHKNSATFDENSANESLQAVVASLRKKYGEDLSVLQKPEGPRVDHAKVCSVTIALYSEVLTLPPEKSGVVLRYMFTK